MGSLMSKDDFSVDGKTVLITGGSRGTGREVGRQLAEKGANIVIVARDHAKLEESIGADLVKPEESVRVIAETTTWNNGSPPDIVWCCAGSSHPTLFLDTPATTLRSEMDNNYWTSAYMAHAIMQAWLNPSSSAAESQSSLASSQHTPTVAKKDTRHLIFTASFLAFYTFTGYTSYSPTKAALRSLSDSLSQEMNLYAATTPVRVHTVYPASIFTESYVTENLIKSDLTKKLEEGDAGQTADQVARACIRGLEAGQEMVTTTLITRLVMCSVLGGTIRGGFWRGLVNWLISCVMSFVMVFVRMDMDIKVRRWARELRRSKDQ
ncbi:hypothetical protein SLS62_002954 [Diatrype stigma]|uniref:3-dehydrosphinganine reductase n=1 Tax=Diatrype stigma TaxID=117547 RepID=A0AAN9UTC8_9PEZI